jgi:uncharacterized heparinase superfamily protein
VAPDVGDVAVVVAVVVAAAVVVVAAVAAVVAAVVADVAVLVAVVVVIVVAAVVVAAVVVAVVVAAVVVVAGPAFHEVASALARQMSMQGMTAVVVADGHQGTTGSVLGLVHTQELPLQMLE